MLIDLQDSIIEGKRSIRFRKIKDHAVYFFYNNENELIYIGKSLRGRLNSRIRSHSNSGSYFTEEVDRIEVTIFRKASDCSLYEVYLIEKYKPIHNVDCSADTLSITMQELPRGLLLEKRRNTHT